MTSPPPPRRSWPRRFLNRLEIDQAVFFAVAVRAWQLLAGPILLFLIAQFLSPQEQGYYFTFGSLLALQGFAELGLRVVILNLTSHEWSRLRLDAVGRIEGDPESLSRLASLVRMAAVWFASASALFAAAVAAAGHMFFAAKQDAPADWPAPWLTLVAVAAMQVAALPFLAVLDGCQQMKTVNRYRLAQAVTATLAGAACLLAGGGLWTAPVIAAARLFLDVWTVGVRYRPFFQSLFDSRRGPAMSWRTEILPLQWRLAVQSVLGWFAFELFNPVVFQYQGAAEAGRMGMTRAALAAIHAAALAWVETRAPLFGVLVARRDFAELDRVYFRVSGISLLLLAAGMTAVVGGVWLLNWADVSLAERLLTPIETAPFAAALVLHTLTQHQTAFLLAHKRNPLLAASVASHALMGAAVWWLGRRYGALGAGLGFLLVVALFTVPLWAFIFLTCRREWRRPPAAS